MLTQHSESKGGTGLSQAIATYSIWLAVVVILAGVVLLILGVRGRRFGQELRCPSCEFDVTMQIRFDALARCPECGENVTLKTVRRGLPRRAPRLIALGTVLLLICVPLVGGLMLQQQANSWLQQRKSATWLLWEWRNGPIKWKSNAGAELLRRNALGVDISEQLREIAADAWPKVRENGRFDENELELFVAAYEQSLVPQREFEANELATYGLIVQTPAVVRQGAVLSLVIEEGAMHDQYRSRFIAGCGTVVRTPLQLTIEDAEGTFRLQLEAGPAKDWPYCNGSRTRSVAGKRSRVELPPGEYRLCGSARVYYLAKWSQVTPDVSDVGVHNEGEVAAHSAVANLLIDQRIRVVPADANIVSLEMDPDLNDDMRIRMGELRASLHYSPFTGRPKVMLSVPSTGSTYAAYTVRLEQNEHVATFPSNASSEATSAWIVNGPDHASRHVLLIVDCDGFVPGPIRVILTPSPEGAEQVVSDKVMTPILGERIEVDVELVRVAQ